MKPLNSPMFRYGGPIKEGIMSGIKEPRQGYNVAGRVLGSVKNFFKPKAPVTGGITATNKGGFIPAMGSKIKQLFTGTPTTTVTNVQRTKDFVPGAIGSYSPIKFNTQTTIGMAPFGPGGPTNQNIYAMLQRCIVPTVGAGGKVLTAAKPYTGIIVIGGTLYSVLKPDGTPKSVDELSAESGADGNKIVEKVKEKITTGGTGDGIELSDKEKREARIQKYRDIVDIKGMNKDAAYNSLIAASQLINQSGDFKGDIKSGKLINDIIQATSKQFDKPKATKDAIDTLILKGEIQSDIAAGKPSAIEQQINAISKNLKVDKETATKMFLKQPTDLRSQVTEDAAVMRTIPTHDIIAGATKKQYPNAEILLSDTEVKEKYGDKMSGEDIIKSLDIFKTANDPSGIYVVGKEVIQIDKQGHTNTIFP